MEHRYTKRHLTLYYGGKTEEDIGIGPITRMELWDRFPGTMPKWFYFMVSAKILLLASMLYLLYQ